MAHVGTIILRVVLTGWYNSPLKAEKKKINENRAAFSVLRFTPATVVRGGGVNKISSQLANNRLLVLINSGRPVTVNKSC